MEVRAPLRLPKREIERFYEQKRGWVEEHLLQMQRRLQERAQYRFGQKLTLLGKSYPVRLAGESGPVFDGACFYLPQEEQAARAAAEKFYRAYANGLLRERLSFFAAKMRVSPSAVRINGAAQRWGSCSGKGSINFSWRLIAAPPDAVDYVVVHELAHLLHHDHSGQFWRAVENVLPDYKRRRQLLCKAQQTLEQEWPASPRQRRAPDCDGGNDR